MVVTIDGMSTTDLRGMGFVFPDNYSVSGGGSSSSGLVEYFPPLFLFLIFGLLIFLLMRMGEGQPEAS
jgi:hypothetical protein